MSKDGHIHACAGAMHIARALHSAMRLPNGDVLVAGGITNGGHATDSVERFSLDKREWKQQPPKQKAAFSQLTVILDDGSFLLVGGSQTGEASDHVERFDPIRSCWTTLRSLQVARFSHTATSLWGGTNKVLVIGGNHLNGDTGKVLDIVELYDVASDEWHQLGERSQARMNHSATLLDSGKVLIIGGYAPDQALAHCELFDPQTGRFEPTTPLPAPRMQHTATLLNNGQVMVAGGTCMPFGESALESFLYDPLTNTWRSGPPMQRGHQGHTATLLPDGRLLLAGHTRLPYRPSTELYDPRQDAWVLGSELNEPRFSHSATLLPDGQGVLLCAGQLLTADTAYTRSCEHCCGPLAQPAEPAQGTGSMPSGPLENLPANRQLHCLDALSAALAAPQQ